MESPRRKRIGILAVALLAMPAGHLQDASAAAAVDYTTQIEPILRASCYGCHQGSKAAAKLQLDSRSGVLAARELIVKRLRAADPKVRMPLGGTALPPEKIALIRAWIAQGAPWPKPQVVPKHWSYMQPVRPAIPKVRNIAWVRNPIDAFVLARLEKEGLDPSPPAPREILLRRVSLDLTGLPPSPREIDDYLADQSPGAYEKVVDRLLASPHYGERWARLWLDLARYADTNGFEADRRRTNWKYRDWVIDALNRDMPFDQFTIEQISGDMLPNATVEQRIATGFHRNTMFNEEGGVDKEEAHWENLIDRVNTTATVWLGSTLGCAQCHNHKYDPFTQNEYYQFLAFFNNSDATQRDPSNLQQTFVEPRLELPTAEQEERRKRIETEIGELERRMKTATDELAREQSAWERSVMDARSAWTTLVPTALKTSGGTTLTLQPDGTVLASGANPRNEIYTIEARTKGGITGIRLEALPDPSLPRNGPGRDAYGNFFVTAVDAEAIPVTAPDKSEKIDFEEVLADNGRINDRRTKQLWTVDASREDQRLPRQMVLVAEEAFGSGETLLRIRVRQDSEFAGQGIGRFRLSVTSAADPTTIITVSNKLRPVLEEAESARTEAQRNELATYYRTIATSFKPARRRLTQARKELDDLGIVSTLVMGDRPGFERPAANIRIRGAFLTKGDLVYANTPAILPGMPESVLPNRLGLARWLVSKENPLTARVTVNRFWEQIFGHGIVETVDDFGSQGAQPTHAELLDWLAVEFMERGWSMKQIQRQIVTSATYRQSSRVSPALLERDPYNLLLARGPRFRLEAETIRDAVLAASGLLSSKIGGPSVFPPQPEGVWDLPYNDDKWVESKGEDRHRRGLYTFVRRTAPNPTMLNFDATSREVCTARRVRTNTPLQALTALNDPAFFEAAQALARRLVAEGGAQPRSRTELAFRLCVARRPNSEELDRLLSWQDQERRFFEQHPADAKKLTGAEDADLAAWTMLSSVLLNLDETLTKE